MYLVMIVFELSMEKLSYLISFLRLKNKGEFSARIHPIEGIIESKNLFILGVTIASSVIPGCNTFSL